MAQITIQQAFDLALQHHQAGRLREAENLFRHILAEQPGHADAMQLLGLIAHQVGRNDIAVDLICRAIALNPILPEAHVNLGNALRGMGQIDQAIAAYRQAISLNSSLPEGYTNLGIALKDSGRLDEAIAAQRQAIALRPGNAGAYVNLGNALKIKGQLGQAVAAYRQAIVLDPNLPEAHGNLGIALKDQGQLDEAIATYRQTIALNPDLPEAYSNLGNALKDTGELDEAVAAYRRAIALRPSYVQAHSNLVYALHVHPGYDAGMIREEHRRWNQQHAEPLRQFIQPHANDRDPDRRLRIGYVSPDFRDHCQALFTVGLLWRHDHERFEIVCYSSVARPDQITRRIAECADAWRDVAGAADDELAELIRGDRIDILVDLTMHMSRCRPLLFARKPAPVQVAWLAYPGTTGLSAMDYRLSDPYLDPPGMDESVYSERTIRLPDSFWCYDPLDCRGIPVNSLPALGGVVTFGCLNNFCKVNDDVLTLWAKVLRQVENSRLLLMAPMGSHRPRTLERFGQEGIDPGRIEFVTHQPRRKYLETYHRIDIGLDTFPYNGHTTSLDSFWMGVPVVTLVGNRAVGRAGWCQLSNLGLAELAGQTPEQFVRVAVELAEDLPRLQQLRSTLRHRMEQSPLMDAPRFARNIEAAYRRMWHGWCQTASANG